ncbi:hypothetical protein DY000_02010239, partial [Brassica cretica]
YDKKPWRLSEFARNITLRSDLSGAATPDFTYPEPGESIITSHYKKTGGSDGRNRQKFVGIDRFRRISDEPIRRYLFVGKKNIRRNFVRPSDDFLTNTEKRHSDELPTIFRCRHTRPEFIGKNYIPTEIVPRTIPTNVVLGQYRWTMVRQNIPTDNGSSVFFEESSPSVFSDEP